MVRSRAEQEARRVLAEAHVLAPPVDVERIAHDRGMEIRRRSLADVSGFLFREGDRAVLGVNRDHAPTRQRFTIAHEIGHAVLHEGRELILDGSVRVSFRNAASSLATDREEIEANQFAAELLMPTGALRALVDALGGTTAGDSALVRKLASTFEVSAAAMGIRLVNLGVLTEVPG